MLILLNIQSGIHLCFNSVNLNPDFQFNIYVGILILDIDFECVLFLETENFLFFCPPHFFFYPLKAGGELTDFIIVLRTTDAVKTFSGNIHLSVGAGLSAAVGIVGRAAEADVRAGDGGYAACYTYSCSKGA
jgi:hypothetical protein